MFASIISISKMVIHLSQKETMAGLKSEKSGSQNKIEETKARSITKNVDGHFSCIQCNYSNRTKQQVMRHIKSVHQGVQYSCSVCEYKARWPSDLRAHTKSKHEGKKYSCTRCDYQATYPQILKQHEASIHDGVK